MNNEILNNPNLIEILKFARKNFIPVLLDETAKLLYETVLNISPKNVLEIGTAIGYSGTIILNAYKFANLTTIEIDEKSFNIAKKNFYNFRLNNRVNQILGDSKMVINDLKNSNQKFDFIFLDGPKGQYIYYLPILKELLNKNGILFADNVLYKNMVLSNEFIPHKKRTIVVNLRKFIFEMQNDKDFETKLLKIGDGVIMAKRL